MHDRTYWRVQDTKRLITEAKDSGHELCIALGERLEDMPHKTSELEYYKDRAELWRGANIALRAEIVALEQELRDIQGLDD